MRLRADDPPTGNLVSLLDMVQAELSGPHLASQVVLRRLSEILFVSTVRAFASNEHSDESGWLAGLADPAVGAALTAIHSSPDRDWSVAELAETAGVSTTTLTERFQRYVGLSPNRYLTRWRMIEARRLLRDRALTVAEVEERVGYASVAAFSRAFQREVGISASSYRPTPRRSK
jgi:transcriptional regulator GlxA family with amidase domain